MDSRTAQAAPNDGQTKRRLGFSLFPRRWRNSPSNILAPGTGRKHGQTVSEAIGAVKGVWRIPSPTEVRRETFEQAIERLNLTESQLRIRHRQFVISSRVSYTCGAIGVLASVVMLSGALAMLAGTAFSVAMIIHGWLRAFRAWQISERKLHRLEAYAKRPEAWFA